MKRKTRVLELIDGYGKSIFYPQESYFFNLFYGNVQDYKLSSYGHREYYDVECKTYKEAIEYLKSIKESKKNNT